MVILKMSMLFSVLFLLMAQSHAQEPAALTTAPQVDLGKYIGVWYEMAKIPNRFQRHCDCNTNAAYSLQSDGRIEVINQCQEKDGSVDRAQGVAKIVDSKTNAKLKVSFVNLFGYYLFWGDYWIIGLDPNYQWAIVGHPQRKYGWILCRNKVLSDLEKATVLKILSEKGYNPDQFQWTVQK